MWVILDEFSQLGIVKSQEIKFEEMAEFNVTGYQAIPLVSVIKMETNQVISLARKMKVIPQYIDHADLDWIPDHVKNINVFLCKNIKKHVSQI